MYKINCIVISIINKNNKWTNSQKKLTSKTEFDVLDLNNAIYIIYYITIVFFKYITFFIIIILDI